MDAALGELVPAVDGWVRGSCVLVAVERSVKLTEQVVLGRGDGGRGTERWDLEAPSGTGCSWRGRWAYSEDG